MMGIEFRDGFDAYFIRNEVKICLILFRILLATIEDI